MLQAALRRRHGRAALRVRGVRPAAARRPPVRRGGRAPAGCSTRSTHFRFDDERLAGPAQTRGRRRGDLRLAGRLPLRRRHLGLRRGRVYFPGSPMLTVEGTFAEAVLLETLVLSILNHDCAIASAAARMVAAPPATGRASRWARGAPTRRRRSPRPGRPTSPGFAATSNLAAGQRYGIPTAGTAAHAFTLLHDTRGGRVPRPGRGARGRHDAAGRHLRHRRGHRDGRRGRRSRSSAPSASTPATSAVLAHQARDQLDALGATNTRIVLSGDLDEYAHRRARRRAGRRLRGRHVAGHRLRRADRRLRLQARRGRGPAGGQALGGQGQPRRPQDRGAPAPVHRHRHRGGRCTPRGRRFRALATGRCSTRWSAGGELARRTDPGGVPQPPPARADHPAVGRAQPCPGASRRSPPPSRSCRLTDPGPDPAAPTTRPPRCWSSTCRTTSPTPPVVSTCAEGETGRRLRSTRGSWSPPRTRARRSSTPRTGTRRPPRTSPRTVASGRCTAWASTWGAELHPQLLVKGPVVRKGTAGEDGYSGFSMRHAVSGEAVPTQLQSLLRPVDPAPGRRRAGR